jgi:hypothetical protein
LTPISPESKLPERRVGIARGGLLSARPTWLHAGLVGIAADFVGILREGELVDPGGVGFAEQQVELPAAMPAEPVVGQLLAADFVAEEPGAAWSRFGVLDVC